MKVVINLSNKVFYSFVLVGMLILFGVGVYAFNGNNPEVMGHASGEIKNISWSKITGIPVCTAGQTVLKWDETTWACGVDADTPYTHVMPSKANFLKVLYTRETMGNHGSFKIWGGTSMGDNWRYGDIGGAPDTISINECISDLALRIGEELPESGDWPKNQVVGSGLEKSVDGVKTRVWTSGGNCINSGNCIYITIDRDVSRDPSGLKCRFIKSVYIDGIDASSNGGGVQGSLAYMTWKV